MSCSRCGSDDHDLSGCKWPSVEMKPRIRLSGGIWLCRQSRRANNPYLGWAGLGYTPAEAYEDWRKLNAS